MNKLGKLNKYLNNDLRNFSKDIIRKIISNQDDNFNIYLKPEVNVLRYFETYDPSSTYYIGSITLELQQDLINKLNSIILDSRPQLQVNTTILPDPTSFNYKEKIAETRRQLRGEFNVTENILNSIVNNQQQNEQRNAEKTKKIQSLSNSVKDIRGVTSDNSGILNLLTSQTANNRQTANDQTNSGEEINMRLAGARESLKINTLENKIDFRYRETPVDSDAPESDTVQTNNVSADSSQTIAMNLGKSSLFFDSAGNPVLYKDFNFSVYKHYEEIKDILNYVPPDIQSENPPLDLRSADNLLRFKVNLEYNFLLRNYEEFLKKNPTVSILNLPYFYEILEFKLAGNVPELSDYDGIPGTFSNSTQIQNTSFLNKPINELEQIISLNGQRDIESLIINSNLGVDNKLVQLDKYLNTFNPFKEQFPFYAEIRFSTHKKPQNNLSDLFHEYNLYSSFLTATKMKTLTFNVYNKKDNGDINNQNLDGFLLEQDFITDLFIRSNILIDPALIFKINARLDNLKRDFYQLINGVQSHTEVVGYVLQKYEKQSSNLLQEWYLPNIGEDYLEWIDTQIKLHDNAGNPEQYTYKINLLVLSIGTVYEYFNPNTPNDEPIEINGNNVTLHYRYRPQFTVFQIQNSSQYTNYISDKPPVEPDLQVIPYVGIDNKIKFNLNSGIGRYESTPINKNEEELRQINFIKSAQNRIDGKIMFESDEPAELFEIYKLDYKPTSYSDIFNGELLTVNTDGNTAASIDDFIMPNKKYYYSVRCKDYHNNYSNPSKIFEVELINDNGTIFNNIQIVDFEKGETLKQEHKTFRRYLKISPALIQKTVDPSSLSTTGLIMGLTTDAVWNKNMKIRLISKQTGRKIDLKFKFKYDINNK